jgi:hypothetical protein
MYRKNPTSPIRSGLDYQDFWCLNLCGKFLANPQMFKWVHFETIPVESDSKQFYLDDIVLLDQDDLYHFYQIKHKQDSKDKWSWDDLLTSEGRKKSLIKKWSESLLKESLKGKVKKAFFATNSSPDNEIAQFLRKTKVDVNKIKSQNPKLYKRLRNEVGIKKSIKLFFDKFELLFNQESIDELEDTTRNFFYEELYATKSGVDNLLLQIHKECRKQQTQPLEINLIRKWCEFDEPKPLAEDFSIPSDFEFFDKATHTQILNDLKQAKGGIKIIFGNPGTGKSVYLSRLYEELVNSKVITIKHHYHISPEDPNPQERLNAERIIEAVKAQFKIHRDDLGGIANTNSKRTPLSEFINTLARRFSKKNKSYVIIIDGLDHALRYGAKAELETFLRQICLPQSGLWIVIGMQPIAKSYLPQIIFDKCPEEKWIEIKGLSKNSVGSLIRKNDMHLNLPKQDRQMKELVEKLFDISSGNPLHLRYSLKQLKDSLGKRLATQYECKKLIAYSGDIEKYYQTLWNQLPDGAKTVLLAISSVNFKFTYEQLIECISSFVKKPADVKESFNSIVHLSSRDWRDRISIYHNSFELFLTEQLKAEEQRVVLKKNIKKWLEDSNYEYLKWAELRKIKWELGDIKSILELDKDWLVDAICYPRNPNQISSQLELASKVAFDSNDFANTLKISHLHTYYLNSSDFVEEATESIWIQTIRKSNSVLKEIDYDGLPTSVLLTLAEKADSRGEFKSIEGIIKVLVNRQAGQEYRSGVIPPVTRSLLGVIPYDRSHDLKKVYKHIKQFTDLDITDSLFRIYSHTLLALGQKEKVKELLSFKLTQEEKQEILKECSRNDLEHRTKEFKDLVLKEKSVSAFCQLYLLLLKQPVHKPAQLPDFELLPDTIPEHDTSERSRWKAFFYDHFLMGLMYALSGKDSEIKAWIIKCPEKWSAEAMSKLFLSSLKIAKSIKSNSKISYLDLFSSLNNLKELKWPEDRDSLSLQHALSDALSLLFKDLILLKKYFNDIQTVDSGTYSTLTSKVFFTEKDLFNIALDAEEKLFTEQLYKYLIDGNKNELKQTVNYFPDRSKDYGELSKLAWIYGDDRNSKVFLKLAADNLLGYGYHKDMYLFDVLEAVDFCAKTGLKKERVNEWVDRLIPIIESVGDFTDGDETNHLPIELARILASHNSKLLYKNYFAKAKNEEFYHSEDLFKQVVRSLSFSNNEQITLATTALDKDSFAELKEIARKSSGAQKAVSIIQDYLGEIKYQEAESSSPSLGKAEYNYSKIKPSQLLSYISKAFENKWDLDNFLVGWITYWLPKSKKESLYKIVALVITKMRVSNVSGEFLDNVYPLAYEFDNRNAFDYICWAQANDNGWARYWTDKKKTERRWEFVKEKYPARYLDFFKKSITYGSGDIQQSFGNIPLSRGVEFLTFFGDLENAENITEASIKFTEELMADLKLPIPNWVKSSSKEVDEIDILFHRLLWPSPLVKERAATGIAYLLVNSPKKKDIYKRLLSWTNSQRMESVLAVALLPIIRAFDFYKASSKLSYIKISQIVKNISANSVVIEKLIQELTRLTGPTKVRLPSYKTVKSCPNTYVISDFFSKFVKTFLAPIYFQRASEIQSKTTIPFLKLWSYTADEIIKDNDISLDANQAYYYGRSRHGEFLLGFSSKISEAYRSSFLRVLQHSYKKGEISEDFYLDYAYATLPIDLSKWKIEPERSPDWWPKLTSLGKKKQDEQQEIVQVSLQEPIENLTKNLSSKNLLMAAEGAIEPSNGWKQSDPDCSFSLIGFGYKVVGPQLPEAKEVAEKILYRPSIITIPSKVNRPFNYLENSKDYLTTEDKLIRIKDLFVYPIVARENDLCITLWQFFRDYDQSFHINAPLCLGLDLTIESNKWSYRNKKGKDMVIYRDWLEGLKERYETEMPIPHGQYLITDKVFVNGWLKEGSLRMGYLLKVTYRYKKYNYDEAEKIEDYKLLNVSRIIIPE